MTLMRFHYSIQAARAALQAEVTDLCPAASFDMRPGTSWNGGALSG